MFPNARPGRVIWTILVAMAFALPALAQMAPSIPPATADHTPAPDSPAEAAVVECNALLQFPVCPSIPESTMMAIINHMRADSGKALLKYDNRLNIGARCHSVDMGSTPCFQHADCDGTLWTLRYNVQGYDTPIGEFVGAGTNDVTVMFNLWMTDSLKRATALNESAHHVAVGFYTLGGSPYTHYWTVAFGAMQGDPAGSPCNCCVARVGNVDCSPGDGVDIGDLTTLIDNLFISFTPLCCKEEANCDGDLANSVDIGDLTTLIDNLFISFSPLPACH